MLGKNANEDRSVSKSIHFQDSMIDDVGRHVNNEFLEDYCCINQYNVGPYIQKLTRKSFTQQYEHCYC